jgi:hypothetical protein
MSEALKVMKFLLNLVFLQGWRVIIVALQVGVVKLYVAAAVEALREMERGSFPKNELGPNMSRK